MIAVVFPGQGAALPWIDPALLERPEVRDRIAIASAATSTELAPLLRRGGRELARTELAQPALVAVCLGVFRLLGVHPAVVAGHSLGELAAWAASGAISDHDAIALAARRGQLMADAAARTPGAMVALRDADLDTCVRALALGNVCVAAHNAPDEYVLSGERTAIARVEHGFATTRLAVAGAWHSPLMATAVAELSAALHAVARRPGAPLVANRTGALAEPDTVPALLAEQLVRPIEWVASQRTLAGLAPHWLAVGPGAVICALARRTVPDVTVDVVHTALAVDRIARVEAAA